MADRDVRTHGGVTGLVLTDDVYKILDRSGETNGDDSDDYNLRDALLDRIGLEYDDNGYIHDESGLPVYSETQWNEFVERPSSPITQEEHTRMVGLALRFMMVLDGRSPLRYTE